MRKNVYNYKRILKKIDKAEVVSFDIFDTLIKRNVSSPKKVFSVVENKYNEKYDKKINDFYYNRIVAQKKARLAHFKDDYNLEELYNYMTENYNKQELKRLYELEIETEIELCTKNESFYQIYEYCKKKNKKIICISDMYLDLNIISKILELNDYILDKIFISSEYRKRKANGDLYKQVIKDLAIKPTKIFHIGDSFKSDFLQAKKNYLKAYHIPNSIINTVYIKKEKFETIDDEILYNILNNNLNTSDMSIISSRGYELFGPLFYGYINWLDQEFKQKQIKKVFFCSRDMKIVADIFKKYYSDYNSKYFYISRKSIRGAYLYKYYNFEDMVEQFSVKKMPLDIFLKNINIDKKQITDKLKKYQISDDCIIDLNNCSINFKKFYDEIIDIIRINNKEKYEQFLKYIEDIDFNGRLALVDSGWNATTQYLLNRLISNVDINGFYFGVEQKAYNRIEKQNLNYYLFSPFENKENMKIILSIKVLFETIICASHGSVIGYKQDKGVVIPLLEENTTDFSSFTIETQDGIINFLEFMFSNNIKINPTLDMIFSGISNFSKFPKLEDAKIFTNYISNNLEIIKNNKPQHIIFYYLFHPKKLLYEIKQAPWKVGYFKCLFKLPLPYYEIYSKIKQKQTK